MSKIIVDANVVDLTPRSIGGIKVERVRDRAPHFNLMVYGKSGVGKTRLAGSAQAVPEMRRVLYIDIEGGIMTLRREFPDVETVRVKTWNDMQGIYNHLFAGGHGYQTVILDSLTEIQKFNMDEIMRKLVDSNDGRDMDVPSLREWGKNLEQTRRFVRAFRDLPLNVIFTALVREDKDAMLRPVNLPSLSGKMAQEVAAFLDIVLYYSVKGVKDDEGNVSSVRVLQSKATESTTAKDRSGLLPDVMLDPDMGQLYDIIVRRTSSQPLVSPEVIKKVEQAEEVQPQAPTDKPSEERVTDEAIQILTGGNSSAT